MVSKRKSDPLAPSTRALVTAATVGCRRPGIDIAALDFETYYNDEYTLKKMSTSEYVFDERFKALSLSLKINDKPPVCVIGKEAIQRLLDSVDWAKTCMLAHHTHFDGLIASHHFGVYPCYYYDTLSMARAIFPKTESNSLDTVASKLGKGNKLVMPDIKGKVIFTSEEERQLIDYNNEDVRLCWEVFQELRNDIPPEEHDLIDVTVRMFAQPVLGLDEKRAKKALVSQKIEKERLIDSTGHTATELSSNKQFAQLLEDEGVRVPKKISPTTKKQTWALAKADPEFTALKNHPKEVVRRLVEARLAVKSTLGESRAQRLLWTASRSPLPVYLNFCGAHTTRWSGGDKMNYQNFPRGGELRKSLLAPPGFRLVVVDSSQIEVRVLAWLAGQTWLLNAFASKRDVYCEFGTMAYGRPITKEDTEERFVAKTCVLGLGYSMGAFKLHLSLLQKGVVMPLEVCEELVRKYRDINDKIVELWELMNDQVMGDMVDGSKGDYKCLTWGREYIGLPNGLFLHYPGADCEFRPELVAGREISKPYDGSYMTYKGRNKIYGGLLTENVVQALARIVVAYQILEMAKQYRVVMMTHDEVVLLVPEKEADQALTMAIAAMRKAPSWAPGLPLDAEGGHDVCYSK